MVTISHEVAFGDVSYGPLIHHTKLIEMTVKAIELLSQEGGYSFREIVEEGGYPYAPVSYSGVIHQYPTYGESIQITAEPFHVGRTSIGVKYVMEGTETNGDFLTAVATHVILDANRNPAPIPSEPARKYRTLVGENGDGSNKITEELDISDNSSTDMWDRKKGFSGTATIRTAHTEAVNLGYLVSYFEFISNIFEMEINGKGSSVRELSGDVYPFKPATFSFEFFRPFEFEEVVKVNGCPYNHSRSSLDVQYKLSSQDSDDSRIEGNIRYGCYNENGDRSTFTQNHLDLF